MKTIIVVYTQKKVNELKRYAFKSSSDVKEGKLIGSSEYSSFMQIINMIDKEYNYTI